ncbi:DUF302 domain-containing protein [Streptacidiphilus sp. ASG 303]|uniref:DUF302 domain-containing protein n=1 Tax=Streptacidiphilus sp. ASG 303 TaxID=2896847 RepID=UPI001E30F65E|nr:DUF302 domain-containing protein [Streptacidiphilus sp. ASG 303]MCD0484133.1 DUF302 domain-containing protein [Streptacidiphilus sp. ASG 303]
MSTGTSAGDPEGVVTVTSPFSVEETVERILRTAEGAGMTVFAVIDHAAGARGAGLRMNPATLVVVGSPKAGTPAMVSRPVLALELPLRVLVWQDDGQQVRVSRQDTGGWADRFGLPEELLAPLSGGARLVGTALTG